jgi:TRAP-type C4-dicarboxylate transport system substrate-binding protein
MNMKLTATVAAAALYAGTLAAGAAELRLSHQWSTKDVRHQVAQIVADEVAAADVDLDIKIFRPSRSSSRASSTSRSAAVSST